MTTFECLFTKFAVVLWIALFCCLVLRIEAEDIQRDREVVMERRKESFRHQRRETHMRVREHESVEGYQPWLPLVYRSCLGFQQVNSLKVNGRVFFPTFNGRNPPACSDSTEAG